MLLLAWPTTARLELRALEFSQKVPTSSMWRHDTVLLARDLCAVFGLSHCFRTANIRSIVALQDMQQYWQACMSTVTASKAQPAHVSLLPCPPSQDPKDAGATDEKFRVSAVEEQFLSSLKLPFGVPVKGAGNEKAVPLLVLRPVVARGAQVSALNS